MGTPQNFLLAFIDELWKTRKIRILKKWTKISRNIIILHMCTKSQSHEVQFLRYWVRQNFLSFWAIFCLLYCSWDMARDRCNYISFWAIYFQPKKWKFQKNEKNTWRYHHFTQVHQKSCSCSWDMAHDRCNWYFSFWTVFHLFTPSTAQKIKISKKWKNLLEISLYTWVPKIMIRWCMVPEIWCVMDGETDGQMEKVTYRGGCPT